MLDQGGLGLRKDPAEIVDRERAQLDPDRQPALQLGQEVGGFGDVEGAGRDEQDVVRLHRAVLGGDARALDQGQKVALNALARDVGSGPATFCAGADLVDLVQEHDAVVLDLPNGLGGNGVPVEQPVGFLRDQRPVGVPDREPARLRPPGAERLAQHVRDVDGPHGGTRHPGDLEHRQTGRTAAPDLDLYLLVVQLVRPELPPEAIARGGRGGLAHQGVEDPLLRGRMRLGLDALAFLVPDEPDPDLQEVADDPLDVAADIADLRELGRLHLQEGRAGEPGEAAGDLRLAAARRSDHQDVLRRHLLAQRPFELLATPAVPQRDRDGALGIRLPDDEAVELGDDLAGREGGHLGSGQV